MRTFPDIRMKKLHQLAGEGNDAYRIKDYPRALELYRDLLRELEHLGLRSGWVQWALAIVYDFLEEYDMALRAIRNSLLMDPLSAPFQRSFDIILHRVRAHLATVPVEDASVARLYSLLQQSGDVDVPTHLIMARHLAATSRLEHAEVLLSALCLTASASRDVWNERARVARLKGDPSRAAEFEAEAHARSVSDVPYAIPSIRKED